jgi:tetratricopeptide (TPR) repeat protein
MPSFEKTWVAAMVVFLSAPLFGNEPPNAKPNPGPGPVVRDESPKPEPESPAHKRYSDSVNARDQADLMRAAYEKEHKPGTVPEDAAKQFEKLVEAYRAAIDIDPRGEVATYCRQRLSGAYTYTGDYDAGLRILIEAVNVAAGPLDQIRACHGAGYHCLQAMHQPGAALRWFKRAEAQLDKLADPDEKAKWQTATAQGIARCHQELTK